jgi:hypothetical protein
MWYAGWRIDSWVKKIRCFLGVLICLYRLLHNKGWQNWKINYGKCWMIN